MKINSRNFALVLLATAGGVGVAVAAIRSSSTPKPSSVANMSDSSMVSMQPEASSCEMCSSGSSSSCTEGKCPQSDSMMNMTMEQTMLKDSTISVGTTKAKMNGEMMPEVNMANTMSQPESDKSMAPSMGASKVADAEQMALTAPKM